MMELGHVLSLAVVPFLGPIQPLLVLALLCSGVAPILAYIMFLGVLICRRERTPFGRLVAAIRVVAFRFSLEVVAWLLGLVVFAMLSLAFYHSSSFGFLLAPFFLSLYAMRTYAWWIVGGNGVPALEKYLCMSGMRLHSKPLLAWTVMGVILNLSSDLVLFMGSGFGRDFVQMWNAPYV